MNTKNQEKSKLVHKLSALERMHLYQPNANVVMVAKIRGIVSEATVKVALKKLVKIHPLVQCKVVFDEKNEAYFESSTSSKISVVQLALSKSISEVISQELAFRFDIKKGPLVRFSLLNNDQFTSLIVNCHHSICDGLALIYLIQDLMKCVKDSKKSGTEMVIPPELSEENIPIKPSFLQKIIFAIVNKKWQKDEFKGSDEAFNKIHHEFWNNHSHSSMKWSLTIPQTELLIQRSKEKEVSVNTTILTAFLRAQNEIQGKKDYLENTIISVNFRDKMKTSAGESFGKFASSIRPKLYVNDGQSFWKEATKNHQIIKKELTTQNIFASTALNLIDNSFIDAITFQKYGVVDNSLLQKMIQRLGIDRINVGTILTNLGLINIEDRFGEYELQEIHGPYVFSDTIEKYVGVLTINEKLIISISFGESFISREYIARIKSRFMQILLEAIGWHAKDQALPVKF